MRKRPLAIAVTAGMAAFALTGCMRVHMDMTLSSNNTVDGTIVMAVSESLATLAGEDPQTLADEMTDDMLSGDTADATVEPYNQDGYVGSTIKLSGEPIDDLGGAGGDTLSIVRDGDTFKVSGTMDMGADAMGLGDLGDLSDPAYSQYTDGFDVRISITFPGPVLSHDDSATVAGKTVTWQPKIGQTLDMQATGSAIGGGASSLLWLWIALAVIVVAALVVVVLLVLRNRKQQVVPAVVGSYPEGYAAPTAGTYPPPGPDAAGQMPYSAPVGGTQPPAPQQWPAQTQPAVQPAVQQPVQPPVQPPVQAPAQQPPADPTAPPPPPVNG